MPYAAARPCRGCKRAGRWERGFCPVCGPQHQQRVEAARPKLSARGWYHDPRWKAMRLRFLTEHPLCVECQRPANTVDHVEPHKMDEALFWSWANLRAMCRPCHSRKTAREDGGWGNPRP